ncbi:hypothetical protein POHY109586_23995 [Polaromonas hydrogenivorans]
MIIAIPPKYAVSQVVGYIKGKSAMHLARVYGESKRNFTEQSFWARGYFVSTVGRDAQVIRNYMRVGRDSDGIRRFSIQAVVLIGKSACVARLQAAFLTRPDR